MTSMERSYRFRCGDLAVSVNESESRETVRISIGTLDGSRSHAVFADAKQWRGVMRLKYSMSYASPPLADSDELPRRYVVEDDNSDLMIWREADQWGQNPRYLFRLDGMTAVMTTEQWEAFGDIDVTVHDVQAQEATTNEGSAP